MLDSCYSMKNSIERNAKLKDIHSVYCKTDEVFCLPKLNRNTLVLTKIILCRTHQLKRYIISLLAGMQNLISA